MGLGGDTNHRLWLDHRRSIRDCVTTAQLDYSTDLRSQDRRKLVNIMLAVEEQRPRFRRFRAQWGVYYVLQEVWANRNDWMSRVQDTSADDEDGPEEQALDNGNHQERDEETSTEDESDEESGAHHRASVKAGKRKRVDSSDEEDTDDGGGGGDGDDDDDDDEGGNIPPPRSLRSKPTGSGAGPSNST